MSKYIGLPLEEVINELKIKKLAYNIIDNSINIGRPFVTNCVEKDGYLLITISNFDLWGY